MSFVDICWLIVKICAGIVAVFFSLGLIAKKISDKRLREQKDKETVTND